MTFNPKIIFAATVAVLMTLSPAFAADKKAPVGALVAWTGDVYLYHIGETESKKVKGMERLYSQDTIVTSAKSMAKVLMNDDSILSLGQNSRMLLKDHLFADADGKRISIFKIFSGKVRTLVGMALRGKESRFQIETMTAVAGVRGTDFFVSANEGDSEIATITGEVSAKNISSSIPEEVIIRPGMTTRVQEGKAPAEPVELSPQRLKELIEETAIPVGTAKETQEVAGCVGCHEKVYTSISGYTNKHLPDISEKCQTCHIADVPTPTAVEIPTDTFTREGIVFLDVEDAVNYKVRIKVKDKAGQEAESRESSFVPSSVSEKLADGKKPPLISNLTLAEIRAGVFQSAVITWETDGPATSQVEYGISKKYGDITLQDNMHTRDHQVVIEKVKPDETYHVRVISRDPFGNTALSNDFTFKSKKPSLQKQDEPQGIPSVDGIKVVKIGDKTALAWKTNRKTTAVISLAEVNSKKDISSKDHYARIKTKRYAGTDSCSSPKCHKDSNHRKATHPIGPVSWKKITPSPDLPLIKGTIMLCSTCHTPHGGNYPLILRNEQNKLCSSCHKDKL